jgi:hypothetical protein
LTSPLLYCIHPRPTQVPWEAVVVGMIEELWERSRRTQDALDDEA